MKAATGDCYEVAARLTKPGFELVHGTVVGSKTRRHGHAWIEYESGGYWMVIDRSNRNNVTMIREAYYAIGRVRVVQRYTWLEAMSNMMDSGHYGPWR